MRLDINVPKAGYLCARSVSFLLRLSPNDWTREHKDSPFTQICKSTCPQLALNPTFPTTCGI